MSAGVSPSSSWSSRRTSGPTTPPPPGPTACWTAAPCCVVSTANQTSQSGSCGQAERVCVCSSRRQPGGEPLLLPGGGGGGGPSGLLRPPAQLLRHQPGDALLQRRDPDRSDSDTASPSYSGVLFIMLTRKICPQVWASPSATPPPSPWWAVTSSGGRRWRTVSPCRAAGSGPSCWLRWCRCSSSCTRGGGRCSSSAPSLQTCASVERCSDQ